MFCQIFFIWRIFYGKIKCFYLFSNIASDRLRVHGNGFKKEISKSIKSPTSGRTLSTPPFFAHHTDEAKEPAHAM